MRYVIIKKLFLSMAFIVEKVKCPGNVQICCFVLVDSKAASEVH
jgi:hypothetical protein